jgi:hypothetical protein
MSPVRPENRERYPADWKLRSRFVRFIRARAQGRLFTPPLLAEYVLEAS